MVTSRVGPADIVAHLSDADGDTRLKAVRAVKNQIIGSKSKKLAYIKLGAIPKVLEILSTATDSSLLVQSAAAVGSFAHGLEDGVRAILEHGGIDSLLKVISSEDEHVVEASVRSLKMIYQSQLAPHEPLLYPPILERLVSLLGGSNLVVAEVAAWTLSHCCNTPQEQSVMSDAGAVEALLQMLNAARKSAQGSALAALSALSFNNDSVCQRLVNGMNVMEQLSVLSKDASPHIRFLACNCLTNIACSSQQPQPSTSTAGDQEREQVKRSVLPVLVRLLKEPEVNASVPQVLARLINDSLELQRSAADMDAIRLLAQCLQDGSCPDKVKEGVLSALAILCMNHEDSRKRLVEAKVLKTVVRGLTDESDKVRAAAAHCVRAVSRSIKNLRTYLVNADVASPLCRLLTDPNTEVQASAAAAICNLVCDHSPVREVVIKNGAIAQLTQLTTSMEPRLRLDATKALLNLMFKGDAATLSTLLGELSWSQTQALLADPEPAVVEDCLGLLRNMVEAKEAVITTVLEWSGEELLTALEDKLDPSRDSPPGQYEHALFAVSHIAAGSEAHKERVMSSNIPQLLQHHLRSTVDHIRLGALWTIVNLTWRRDETSEETGPGSRAQRLCQVGLEEQIRGMQNDASMDVRERVKNALAQLK